MPATGTSKPKAPAKSRAAGAQIAAETAHVYVLESGKTVKYTVAEGRTYPGTHPAVKARPDLFRPVD